MNRIVFALLAFVLARLGNGQFTSDCIVALTTVSPTCATLFHNPNPSDCIEECYRQFSKLASACADSVSDSRCTQI